ncbi:MAG: hypothetical protein DRP66_01970 [Planctomycetota bacterium]|nr:MAG: hypothetical protein DRP66_01970 [Planctomycetota bacterium]
MLLAAGILVIGFMLIAGSLPVGIKLTAMGTERTIGAVAADEAFAKVRLFGLRNPTPADPWPADPNVHCVDYAGVSQLILTPNSDEYSYPSTDVRPDTKKYYWAAMCKYNLFDLGLDTFQVTVFVSRDTGLNTRYPYPSWNPLNTNPLLLARYPRPVQVPVDAMGATGMVDTIQVVATPLSDSQEMARLITDESVLLDDRTGQIMRVLKRGVNNPISGIYDPTIIRLENKLFDAGFGPRHVWVIPPAKGSGRYPGVGVYQRTIKFK